MKEYWVNVYEFDMGMPKNRKDDSIRASQWIENIKIYGYCKYRLHVREFETCEAKELYLAYKYNRPRTGTMIKQHCEMIMEKNWSIWE